MLPYSDMAALIQSENHAANKGKTTGRYQFDTHSTGIGLSFGIFVNRSIPKNQIQIHLYRQYFNLNLQF